METRKYQIIRDDEHKIEYEGKTLYRIQALRDVSTRVKAGDMGGYIENYDNLSQVNECWVGGNAKVMGNAFVNSAYIKGESIVGDVTFVYKNTIIEGNVIIKGRSKIGPNSVISGNLDNTWIIDGISFDEWANIGGPNDLLYIDNIGNLIITAYKQSLSMFKLKSVLKPEEFLRIVVDNPNKLEHVFSGTFSEYLRWINQNYEHTTKGPYAEHMLVAQLIHHKFGIILNK